MTLHELGTLAGIVVSALSLAITIFLAGIKNAAKIASIEVKVDTLWDFQIRRGFSEAVQKGIGTMNSPLILTEEAKSWLDCMAAELRRFYQTIGHKLNDRD